MSQISPRNIIISRTDSIGDVVLTLPMAAVLKKHFPGIKIGFMGKSYTKAVIESCVNVDTFIDVTDFLEKEITIDGEQPACIIHVLPVPAIAKRAKKLNIPVRIGTTNRLYHWLTCNKLVKLSRKNSSLHEAQLNLALLQPLGITHPYSLQEIGTLTGIDKTETLEPAFAALIQKDKYNVILHPKSQGSAREWPLEKYIALIRLLNPSRYNIFISGTAKEKPLLQPILAATGDAVTDISGQLSLPQFMAFIRACDGLVACSTGPIHIAAAMGKDAYGIYPPMRPIHPGRWAPIGPHVAVFVEKNSCIDCKKQPQACHCIIDITAVSIFEALEKNAAAKLT